MSQNFRFVDMIWNHVQAHPERLALSIPQAWDDKQVTASDQLSYGELGSRVAELIQGLKREGIGPGDRVILLFPVTVDMICLMIALFARGAVPTFVDPGMGLRRAFQAIKGSKAKAIVTLPGIVRWRRLIPPLRSIIAYPWRKNSQQALESLLLPGATNWEIDRTREDGDEGIITFTSGTSGRPKAANRTRAILQGQHEALNSVWTPTPDEVAMTCFPISSLFYICHGVTCIFPAVDLAKPGQAKGKVIVKQMLNDHVTSLFGAPAFLESVFKQMSPHDKPTKLRTVVTGGAPTPTRLAQKIVSILPDSQNLILYGSTEAEPIAYTSMDAVIQERSSGYLVGSIVDAATVRLIPEAPSHQPSEDELKQIQAAPGEVGELWVQGPHVVEEYLNHPEANRLTKIRSREGLLWHRTGDLAYRDSRGRLCLVGRAKDELRNSDGNLIFPFPVEEEIDQIPGVQRSALLEVQGTMTLVFEAKASTKDLETKILSILGRRNINAKIVALDHIPVDRRHNSKIDRNQVRRLIIKS